MHARSAAGGCAVNLQMFSGHNSAARNEFGQLSSGCRPLLLRLRLLTGGERGVGWGGEALRQSAVDAGIVREEALREGEKAELRGAQPTGQSRAQRGH